MTTPSKCIELTKENTRLFPVIGFVICIILIYIMALAVETGAGTLIFGILEWVAWFWYAISFIPDARDAVWSTLTSCC